MTTLGLAIIAAAWLLQYFMMDKKKSGFNQLFLIFYFLGVMVLAYESFTSQMVLTSLLNLVSGFVALAVLLKVKN